MQEGCFWGERKGERGELIMFTASLIKACVFVCVCFVLVCASLAAGEIWVTLFGASVDEGVMGMGMEG